MVLGEGHYLVVQRFGFEADNPSGSGFFRSIEIPAQGGPKVLNLEQPKSDVVFHGAYGGGAGLVVETPDELISLFHDGSSWQRRVLSSLSQRAYAVGVAADGSPRVAVGSSNSPSVLELHSANGATWSKLDLDVQDSHRIGAVGEDAAGDTHLWMVLATSGLHLVFSGKTETSSAQLAPKAGYEYLLFFPDSGMNFFVAGSTKKELFHLTPAGWEPYALPFAAAGNGHSVFGASIEHLWSGKLYACRKLGAAWTTLALDDLKSGSVDDLQRDANQLVVVSTGSSTGIDTLQARPVDDCRL